MNLISEPIRRVRFNPFRKGMGPTFSLTMWETGRTADTGQNYVQYRLTIREPHNRRARVLFEGDDFGCSPLHCIDSDECVYALMGFLTLRKGDTDAEYFDHYTQDQLRYCEQWAESLSCEVEYRFGEPMEVNR